MFKKSEIQDQSTEQVDNKMLSKFVNFQYKNKQLRALVRTAIVFMFAPINLRSTPESEATKKSYDRFYLSLSMLQAGW